MRNSGTLASSSALSAASAAKEDLERRKVYGAGNIARVVTQNRKNASNLIARSKYMPHQGEQEVARRQHQKVRDVHRQMSRAVDAGLSPDTMVSRRGRVIAQTA